MLVGTVIVLSLIVILLAMPVRLTYQFAWKQTPSAQVRLNWAFGLLRADVSPDPSKPRPEKKAARRGKSKGKKANVLAAIRQPSFRRRVFRFLADAWHAIHKQNVRLQVRLGLGDPADTGQLWAVLGPVSAMLAGRRDVRIAIEPDFGDATLEVDSSGTVWLVPLQMVIIVLGLLLSPSVWRGLSVMRKSA